MIRPLLFCTALFVVGCKSSPEVVPSASCESLRDKWLVIAGELVTKTVASVNEKDRVAVQAAGDAEVEAIRTKFVGVCQSMGARVDGSCFDDAAALKSERCAALNKELSKQIF